MDLSYQNNPGVYRLYKRISKLEKKTPDYSQMDENGPHIYEPGIYLEYSEFTFLIPEKSDDPYMELNRSPILLPPKEIKEYELKDKSNWIRFCEKLNRSEFQRALERLVIWRKKLKDLPFGKETLKRNEFLENYLERCRYWFMINKLEEPTFSKIKDKKKKELRILWSGGNKGLNQLYNILIGFRYIDGIDYEEFSQHFSCIDITDSQSPQKAINWLGKQSEFVYIIGTLFSKGLLTQTDYWKTVSEHFVINNKKKTARNLTDAYQMAEPLNKGEIKNELKRLKA